MAVTSENSNSASTGGGGGVDDTLSGTVLVETDGACICDRRNKNQCPTQFDAIQRRRSPERSSYPQHARVLLALDSIY